MREGLTNAAKHAPGQPVTVRVDETTVTVENPVVDGNSAPGNGSGLAGLREVARIDAGRRDGRFVLTATLAHGEPPRRRTPSRVWRLVRVPRLAAGVVVVLGGGLYFVAGSDNRLDPAVFGSLHIGQSQEDVEKVLPRFQILGDPEHGLPAAPPHADCRHYWATEQTDERLFYRLCFVGGRLAVIAAALGGGARGFLLKSGDPRELFAGIRAVAQGAAFLSPTVAHRVIQQVSGDRLASAAKARVLVDGLTPREREVLALVGAGLPNAEIASRLHVVEGTVKVFVTSILRRLAVANRVQAAIVAYEAGLV